MKFAQLQIENFLAITAATVAMADRGLCLIQGENQDDPSAVSNGAGKSSIADALCWALYGTTARGVSGDDVINDAAGKGTMVGVRVEDGRETYLIKRHRKHKTGKNAVTVTQLDFTKPGVETDLTLGTDRLTQERIDKIIGCSYEVFRAAVYAGQEQMPDLPAMTDKNLKLLLEEAAGVSLLEEAYADARKRALAAAQKRSDIGTKLDAVEGRHTVEIARLVETKDRVAIWKGERDAKIALETKAAQKYRDDIALKVSSYDTTRVGLIDTRTAEIDAQISSIKDEIDQDRLNDKAKGIAHYNVDSFAKDISTLNIEISRLDKVVAKIHAEIGCPCPECARLLTVDEVGPRREVMEKLLIEAREKRARIESRHGDALKTLESVTETRDVFRASMTDASKISAERASLQTEKLCLADHLRSISDLKQSAIRKIEEIKAMKLAENPYSSMILIQENKITAIAEELAGLKISAKAQSRLVDVAESVAKVFSPAGVRAHILDEITPFLNGQTAKYLGSLSDGNISATWSTLSRTAKGELRERFVIEVSNLKGAKSFQGLSGGEKRKVRIACALALQDLVARRAVKPIELFIGDEIDDALDTAGLERLMGILEEKAKERGSVFVISHRSLRDWISNMLLVVKTDKGSTIEEVVL